ncbi:MAG: PDZ domain-containing protein [Terriglobales bacterium]
MRFRATLAVLVLTLASGVLARNPTKRQTESEPKPVTVPMTLDQGRVVIDVDLALANGSTERVRGWVDNGNPNLYISKRVAGLMGLGINCDGQVCSGSQGSPPVALEILIGGMKISLSAMKEIKVPVAPTLAPGMSAEINIPSAVLRNYDVLFNFPDREFTIGLPGSLKFNGVKGKMLVNASNGLIQIPSRIDNKNYDLALDLGSSINLISEELFDKLSNAHPDWPHMTGAVGPFNTGEPGDEPKTKLMRLDRVQYGPLFLTDVGVADLSKDRMTVFQELARISTSGQLGSEALMNYRVGLDYAHSIVYFDIGRTIKFPGFDVVGLILRPEDDNRFTILAAADFDGSPSVPGVQAGDRLVAVDDIPVADSTLGQVWSLLEGSPGQERKLTIERAGKRLTVAATVRHFLGSAPGNGEAKEGPKKN